MADEIQISGAASTAKLRNPLGVIGLSLVTLGIYYFFWWYFINREMRDLGHARGKDLGQSPGNSVLAVSLGALIVVPAIVSMWRTSDRVERTQEVAGMERRASGPIIFILLILIGPVGLWYTQNELNKAWQAQAEGGEPAALPPEQPVTQQPPGESRPAPVAPEAPDAQ